MGQKVTNNPSKFYFWVKKLQNGPKSDKQSVEILFLGVENYKRAEKRQTIHRNFIFAKQAQK